MVFSVALSADRQTLASSGHDGLVRLWDAGSGELRATLQGHIDAATGVALSADGRMASRIIGSSATTVLGRASIASQRDLGR